MTDAEHAELARAVQMLRDAGFERPAFLLSRAWREENEKAKRKNRKTGTWTRLPGGSWACLDSDVVARAEPRDPDMKLR